jgi:sugar phosphate isomerase/epimerase
VNGNDTTLSARAGHHHAEVEGARQRLLDRLGLNVPYEWWPRAAALKAIEAAGFHWVQVASPPIEMLADPRYAVRHGRALRESLEVTSLCAAVHGPTDLQLGSSLHNRAAEGLLEHAHQVGASHVVLHVLDRQKPGAEADAEESALKLLARWAESLGLVICIENLCNTYPGPPKLAHDPSNVRRLVENCDSPAVRMVLDVGHANVVADREGADIVALIEPVLDDVGLFHVHDNLGWRRRGGDGFLFDPLRLDLHLPPSIGSLPWKSIAKRLVRHQAPLMLEIHPSHRPSAVRLRELTESVLIGSRLPAGPPAELSPASL